jgi:hypothetical protein
MSRIALRTAERRRVAAVGGVAAAAIISALALVQWDASFNPPYRDRVAAIAALPAGPFYAIDAAAWRWIADRPIILTPSGGFCAAPIGADTVVLEPAHFSAYSTLYDGAQPVAAVGPIPVFAVRSSPASGCGPQ